MRLPAVSFNAQQYPNAGDVTASPACLTLAPSHTAADADALNLCGSAGFEAGQFERAEQLLAAAARRLPHHAGLSENLELARRRRAAH